MSRVFVALALLGFFSTSQAVVVSDQMEAITQFLVLSAPRIKVTKTADPNVAEITITPKGRTLVATAPTPFSRNIPARGLTNDVWKAIFESQSIPASLTWNAKRSAESGVFLSVVLKSINGKTGCITLIATVNPKASAALADKGGYAGNPFTYGILQDAALTLDDQQGRVIRGDGSQSQVKAAANSMTVQTAVVNGTSVNGCVIQPFTACPGADLSFTNLVYANLMAAVLFKANLYGANLLNANLSFADLLGANLYGANLLNANLSNADLNSAIGCSTTKPPLNPLQYDCIN